MENLVLSLQIGATKLTFRTFCKPSTRATFTFHFIKFFSKEGAFQQKMLVFKGPSIQNEMLTTIKKVRNLNTNINKIAIFDIRFNEKKDKPNKQKNDMKPENSLIVQIFYLFSIFVITFPVFLKSFIFRLSFTTLHQHAQYDQQLLTRNTVPIKWHNSFSIDPQEDGN